MASKEFLKFCIEYANSDDADPVILDKIINRTLKRLGHTPLQMDSKKVYILPDVHEVGEQIEMLL